MAESVLTITTSDHQSEMDEACASARNPTAQVAELSLPEVVSVRAGAAYSLCDRLLLARMAPEALAGTGRSAIPEGATGAPTGLVRGHLPRVGSKNTFAPTAPTHTELV
jgi:hypothetical protein